MSFLTDAFRQTIAKEKLGEENLFIPTYKTGMDLFDYRNGRTELGDICVGVDGGKIFTIVGKSGTGKSTLAIQMSGKVVEPYENGQVVHLDYERATTRARIQQVTQWSEKMIKQKYILMNSKIYSESLYSLIKATAKLKLDNYDQLKLSTGKKDDNGDEVYVLPPTVFLVDSWASMIPKNISEEDELSGSMSASAIAKANNAIAKRILGALEEANIILIIVNHITQKIEIGPVKTQASLNFLKQDESIPGGSSCIYLANTLLKLQASSKLDPEKDFGVKGFKTFGELLKSRSNAAGIKFEMVFDQANGYDNILTTFNMLKGLNYLKGNGRAYYFDALPDSKFTQKNFRERYLADLELQEVVDELARVEMEKFLSTVNTEDLKEEGEIELVKHIEGDIFLGNDGKKYHFNEDNDEVTPLTEEEELAMTKKKKK